MFTTPTLLHDLHPADKALKHELLLVELADKLLPVYEVYHLSGRSHYLLLCRVPTVLVRRDHDVASGC